MVYCIFLCTLVRASPTNRIWPVLFLKNVLMFCTVKIICSYVAVDTGMFLIGSTRLNNRL